MLAWASLFVVVLVVLVVLAVFVVLVVLFALVVFSLQSQANLVFQIALFATSFIAKFPRGSFC